MNTDALIPIVPTAPNRVPTDADKVRSHELRQQLIQAGDVIDLAFRRGAVAIIGFLNDPVLMRVQGWDSEEEFWRDPDVQRVVRVELGSQMLLEKYVQRQRAKFMLWAHVRFPQIDWTQVKHTTITQTGRAPALRELAERAERDGLATEVVTEEAEKIVFSVDPPKSDDKTVDAEPDPEISVKLKDGAFRLLVNGDPIVELKTNIFGIRFASVALHLISPKFRIEGNRLVVYHGDEMNRQREVVGQFLVEVNSDDPDFMYLLDKTHTVIVPD